LKAYSLPKKIVLKKNADFKSIFKDGIRLSTDHFFAVFVVHSDLKVGFASSKEIRTKPKRNRIKRIARELWRLNYQKFNLNVHVVIIAKPSILETNFNDLTQEFCFLLQKIQNRIKQ